MAESKVVVNTAKDNTKIYMILGVLAIAGIAMYMLKKKDEPAGMPGGQMRTGDMIPNDIDIDDIEDEEEEEEEEEEVAQDLNTCIRMGSLHDNWVGIQSRSRYQAGNIQAGTKIKISNTTQGLDGNYTVLSTWIDTNGNVGAMDLETNYTPRLTNGPDGTGGLARDYTFDGEGLICMA